MDCCDDGYVDCAACEGDGYVVQEDADGELGEDPCNGCGGRGWLVCCG